MRCREALGHVHRFEATHCLDVMAMGPAYVAARRELAQTVLRSAHALGLPEEVRRGASLRFTLQGLGFRRYYAPHTPWVCLQGLWYRVWGLGS